MTQKKLIIINFVTDFVSIAAMGVALLWSAGRWDWWPAWTAIAVMCVCTPAIGIVTLRFHPDLLKERTKPPKSAKRWDNVILSILRLTQLARYILGGLDQRYGWTGHFPPGLQIAGAALCFFGYGLFLWALASNKYFSQVVRVQVDRGQTVAAGGPYRLVRHPSYAGMLLFELAMSALLGSWWSLLAGGICALLFILRTALEDRTLLAELPGYAEFTQKVRYRLIPGIW